MNKYKDLQNILETNPYKDLQEVLETPIANPYSELNAALQKPLKKAIVSNPMMDLDLNTAEQALDEASAKDSDWVDIIQLSLQGMEFTDNPRTIALPGKNTLYLSRVDDGFYSGFVKKEDEEAGNNGENLVHLSRLTVESIVTALKAKEYLPKESVVKQEAQEEEEENEVEKKNEENQPEEESKDSSKETKYRELQVALRNYKGKELHIHLH